MFCLIFYEINYYLIKYNKFKKNILGKDLIQRIINDNPLLKFASKQKSVKYQLEMT